jgi:hypothetical protein
MKGAFAPGAGAPLKFPVIPGLKTGGNPAPRPTPPLDMPGPMRMALLHSLGLHSGWLLLTNAEFKVLSVGMDWLVEVTNKANDLKDAMNALDQAGLIEDAPEIIGGDAARVALDQFKASLAIELPPRATPMPKPNPHGNGDAPAIPPHTPADPPPES